MPKILIKVFYFLPLVPLAYISIIYIFIYLNLINIRMLRRLRDIKSLLKTLLKDFILLFTGFINILSFLKRIYL